MALFTADYEDTVSKDLAKKVIADGKQIGRSEYEKDTYWAIYEYEGKNYIGLCDFVDIWAADSDDVEDYLDVKY